jgi:hypothetical protein
MITERQSHGYPTFWQRLILVGVVLLSGEFLARLIPIQATYANINCVAGNGGPGGTAIGGQNGAIGGIGGDCVIGGNKAFSPGGFNQNSGTQGNNQANGGSAP